MSSSVAMTGWVLSAPRAQLSPTELRKVAAATPRGRALSLPRTSPAGQPAESNDPAGCEAWVHRAAPRAAARSGGRLGAGRLEAQVHVKISWQLSVETIDHLALISACSVSARESAQMSKIAQRNSTPGVSVIHTQAHAGSLQQFPQLVPAGPGGGGKAVPPSKQSKKSLPVDHNSDEYRQRRERNNMAVKKSRLKSKQKAQDTLQRVNQLKEENERLEAKIKLLTKELSVLKDLFLEHADNVQPTSTENTTSDNAGQ
ncbi:CCAAT/enhancer-binding protein gamma-like [Neomonachus schauinslandi]|uniref:CCAAT/enhancer-binding protein gamma n=1 Tax=Neomonachus schauinslandi TaxID=29088 RepID=A0A2Y9HGW5_NEOSC|nr:CCAAT/enhancer-binding protein gamma-like [Neomonachus schauinslandi]